MIHISSDWSDVEHELRRLEGLPDSKATALLDGVLEASFADVVARTHVITGSLKSSMKKSTDEDRRKWTGTIEAGGVSAGVNNPVDYAIYEKARGGDHDFFGNLHLMHSKYVDAMLKGLAP